MKRLVIYGTGDVAQLAHHYFTRDTEYEVAAFTVDAEFATSPEFCGRPVVPFDRLVDAHPPDGYEMFVALGYARVNGLRRDKYAASKALGYRCATYVSPRAT